MKDNKGITLTLLIITIIIILIFASVILVFVFPWNDVEKSKSNNISNNINEQVNCQHEWVITSKYNILLGKYKTISKCTKCGKEIE